MNPMKKSLITLFCIHVSYYTYGQCEACYNCDSLATPSGMMQLNPLQDSVNFTFTYRSDPNDSTQAGIYIGQWVTLSDYSVIDTVHIDFGNTVAYWYPAASRTYLLRLVYKTSSIPLNYSVNGNYTIHGGTLPDTCQIPFTLFFNSNVGLPDFPGHDGEIKIYPNPSNGNYLYIDFEGAEENMHVIITDIYGKKEVEVKRSIKDDPIGISSLAKGIYFITISGRDSKTITQKFVKL